MELENSSYSQVAAELEEKTEIYSIMQDIQTFKCDLKANTEDHSGM
jgi:hypothetical protein